MARKLCTCTYCQREAFKRRNPGEPVPAKLLKQCKGCKCHRCEYRRTKKRNAWRAAHGKPVDGAPRSHVTDEDMDAAAADWLRRK